MKNTKTTIAATDKRSWNIDTRGNVEGENNTGVHKRHCTKMHEEINLEYDKSLNVRKIILLTNFIKT